MHLLLQLHAVGARLVEPAQLAQLAQLAYGIPPRPPHPLLPSPRLAREVSTVRVRRPCVRRLPTSNRR